MEDQRQILEELASSDHRISESELAQLRRAGVIHSPTVRSLGRPAGTVSEYPDGTTRQLLRFLAANPRRPRRRLREKAWRLWWDDDGDLVPAVRAQLDKTAHDWERTSRWLGRLLDNEFTTRHAANALERLYKASQSTRLDGPLAAARRRVGMNRFSTVTNLLSRIGTGRFTEFDDGDIYEDGTPVANSPAALLERALGLDRARTDRLADVEPWYSGPSQADFARLSRLLFSRPPQALVSRTSNSSLQEARNEMHAFATTMTVTADLTRRLFGTGAFGFGVFARSLRPTSASLQALFFLGWLTLSEEEDLRVGMSEIASLESKAEAWNRLYAILDELRREVPAMSPVLADRRLGKALQDHAAAAELAAEIRAVRAANQGEIDAFFDRHADVNDLLAAAQT
jgi:hypothetical protein